MEQLGKEKLSPVSNDNPLVVKHMDGWMDGLEAETLFLHPADSAGR